MFPGHALAQMERWSTATVPCLTRQVKMGCRPIACPRMITPLQDLHGAPRLDSNSKQTRAARSLNSSRHHLEVFELDLKFEH